MRVPLDRVLGPIGVRRVAAPVPPTAPGARQVGPTRRDGTPTVLGPCNRRPAAYRRTAFLDVYYPEYADGPRRRVGGARAALADMAGRRRSGPDRPARDELRAPTDLPQQAAAGPGARGAAGVGARRPRRVPTRPIAAGDHADGHRRRHRGPGRAR